MQPSHTTLYIGALVVLLSAAVVSPVLRVDATWFAPRQYDNLSAYLDAAETYRETGVLLATRVSAACTAAESRHTQRLLAPCDPSGRTYLRLEDAIYVDDLGYALFQAAARRFGLPPAQGTNAEINRALYAIGVLAVAAAVGWAIGRRAVGVLGVGLPLLLAHPALGPVLHRYADHHGAAGGFSLLGLAYFCLVPAVLRSCRRPLYSPGAGRGAFSVA